MNELKPKVLTLLDDKFTFLIPTDLFWTQLLEVLILVIFPKFTVPNIIMITLEHIIFLCALFSFPSSFTRVSHPFGQYYRRGYGT